MPNAERRLYQYPPRQQFFLICRDCGHRRLFSYGEMAKIAGEYLTMAAVLIQSRCVDCKKRGRATVVRDVERYGAALERP